MKQLLLKARARVIRHLVLDKGALALVIGLGAFIVLLLIGTQVLDWYWPVVISAVSLGVGVYQLRKNMPSTYEVAQRIDHRCGLADSLSTAFYFSEHPKPGFEAVSAAQYRAAEQLASGVDLPQALPMPRSRYLLPASALLLAAAGLFGVRYFLIGSLDLKSSLLEAVADTFFSSKPEEIAKNSPKERKKGAFDPSQPALPVSPEEEKRVPPDAEKGQNLSQSKENQNSSGDEKGQGNPDEQNSDDQQQGDDQSQNSQDKQGDKGRESQDKNESPSQGNEQRNLMDKLRDAMNNLMNKMSSNDGKQNGQKGGEKQKGQKQDKNGKSEDSQNADDAQADNNQNGQDGKQQESQKSANAPGQKPSDQAASGQGENDGKKAIEEAKMLEAMGKLNELIGERSNQITGDMTVEVGSSQQQLKTELTHQKAGHTDAGGEIHRDQVPLADQLFVEQYFKEVRKSGPAGAAKSNAKAASTKADTKK